MLAIYKKELGSYFRNPLGYVFVSVYLVASALIFCYTTFKAKSYDTSKYFALIAMVVNSVHTPTATKVSATLPFPAT